ncbi:MAG: Ribulose-phosphate 3-epimerase [Parcubacteria group bacterium GW2011_GWF2_38_8]|nr:MAG: Ribulose-phosphate 3-epimerase [Parcubacteria group bacterium GW2011_GWF2_38_8]
MQGQKIYASCALYTIMIEIIPAVLPKNYEDLKNKIALVRGIVPVVQIDICDGIFVPNLTWPFLSVGKRPDLENSKRSGLEETDLDDHFRKILNEKEGMPFWEDIDFELDLLVSDAVENFDIYTKLGAKKIVFHIEAVGNLEEFKNFMEGIDTYMREMIEIGVAVNIDTPMEQVFPLISNVDFVQCMGINKVGFQEQEFDERVIENIKILKGKFPDLIISVDGGIDFNTAPALSSAGASRLVIGSAIFNTDDIIGTIEEFRNL